MEESQEKTIANLTEVFSGVASYTKLSNKNANPNVNQHLEAFFTELFNILFEGLSFEHLDLKSINSKGLDILIIDKTIGIQVTVDHSLKKVRETIKKVLPLKLPLKKLLMLYPADKKPKRDNTLPKQAFQIEEWSFNEIIQKIRGLDEYRITQIKHLSMKYFPWLNSVQKSFEILNKLYPSYFISGSEIPEYQIERKISELLTKEDLGDESKLNNLDSIDLEPYLLEKKRVVLVGESGMGKTNELKKFAIALAEKKEYYPYFESLKNFSDYSSIEELLPEEWEFVPREKRVLIFDGFDEIGIQFSLKIQSMFKVFIKKYPETLILISSRGSFFFNELNGEFIDFSRCYLHKFSWQNIHEFVDHIYGINGEEFINSSYSMNLIEWAEKPYSLNLLAQEYESFKYGKKSSSEVIKLVFDKRVEYDLTKHFKNSFPNTIEKSILDDALEKIATIMTIGGYSQISNRDLRKIIYDEKTLSNLKQLLIFDQIGDSKSQWSFEHNQLRDYFAAKHLSDLDFISLKELVCESNTNYVLSNWLDAFKFFLDTEDFKSPLFNQLKTWLFENDYHLLVSVNREKIDVKLRIELLKKVVKYYHERDIWIRLNGIQENRFSYFIQSRDSLEFLINEIKSKTSSRRQILNCLFILDGFLELSETEKINVRDSLIPLMVEVQDDTYLSSVFIETFSKLKITDEVTEDKFRTIYGHRKNQFIRGPMYSYISIIDEPDNWLDFLLEGIQIKVKREREDREDLQNGSESITLSTAFKALKNQSSYLRILDEFNENDSYESFFGFQDVLTIILKNSAKDFSKSDEIFEKVFLLNSKLNIFWSQEYRIIFFDYFQTTGTLEKGLKKSLKLSKSDITYHDTSTIASFLTSNSIRILKPLIKSGELSFDLAESIYYSLKAFNHELLLEFKEMVESETKQKIKILESVNPPDKDSFTHKKLYPWFQIDLIKKEITQLLNGKETIDSDYLKGSLFKGEIGNTNELDVHHLAKKILRELTFSLGYPVSGILELIKENDEFEDYLIHNIMQIIYRRDPLRLLTNPQILFLKTWFQKNITKINFDSIQILEGSVDYYTVNKAKNLTFLFQNFYFPCSDEVKLDMLAFCNDTYGDFHTVTIARIIDDVGKEKVEKRIEENISKRSISNRLAIKSHFKYIFQNRMKHLFDDVFLLMTESDGKEKRNFAGLNDFFTAGNNPNILYKFFDDFIEEDQIYILLQIQNEHLDSVLLKFLSHLKLSKNKSKEFELAVSSLQIRLGQLEGLKMIITWIQKHKENPFYRNDINLVYSNDIKALPYLIELLHISYDKSIGNNVRFNTIWSTVKKGLINLSSVSNEYASEIIARLEKFIFENFEELEDINFNYEIIEDIKSDLLNQRLKAKSFKIRDCILLYEEVF